MEYEIVYDLVTHPKPFDYIDFFILFVTGFLTVATLANLLNSRQSILSRLVFLTFVLFLVTPQFIGTLLRAPDPTLLLAMQENRYVVVEGEVSKYAPDWSFSGQGESFEIDGEKFSYSRSSGPAGYRQTRRFGGKIREGSHVIIWHVDGDIIHLEIAVDDLP